MSCYHCQATRIYHLVFPALLLHDTSMLQEAARKAKLQESRALLSLQKFMDSEASGTLETKKPQVLMPVVGYFADIYCRRHNLFLTETEMKEPQKNFTLLKMRREAFPWAVHRMDLCAVLWHRAGKGGLTQVRQTKNTLHADWRAVDLQLANSESIQITLA